MNQLIACYLQRSLQNCTEGASGLGTHIKVELFLADGEQMHFEICFQRALISIKHGASVRKPASQSRRRRRSSSSSSSSSSTADPRRARAGVATAKELPGTRGTSEVMTS